MSEFTPLTMITGVGKGFGRELFIDRVRNFGGVVGLTRSSEDIALLRTELANEKSTYFLFEVDVTDHAQIYSIIAQLQGDGFGVVNLINNAGMRFRKPFLEISNEDLMSVFNNNLISVHNLCRACIPGMIKNNGGRIVNISSVLGDASLPHLAGYNVSKGALNALTRSLAVEFAEHNIAVNSVAPGFCKTSYYQSFRENEELYADILARIPMARWGESSEIVGICNFLLSESAGYISGTTIPVDGGWLAC